MKKWILTSLLLVAANWASAQAWTGSGDQKAQFGLSVWGNGTGITGTYDYGISDLISLGGGVNFYFDNFRDNNNDNNFFLFGRFNVHLRDVLDLPEKFDVYPGLDVGLLGNDFGLGAHIGARYFFTENIGAFIEAGNNGSIGVSLNF